MAHIAGHSYRSRYAKAHHAGGEDKGSAGADESAHQAADEAEQEDEGDGICRQVDKLKYFRGDPASVLLEVLDPEQNIRFTDNYLDVPFDLSRIMFTATANDLSKLPGPILDRMERIEFAGYTEKEKLQIAQQFILPRQLKATGLSRSAMQFSPEAISRVISDYTRESGLRNLERELADVCRKIALLCLKTDSHGGGVAQVGKQMPRFDDIAVAVDQDTLDNILQFPDIIRDIHRA